MMSLTSDLFMTASSSYYTLELVSHILPRRTIRSDGVFVIIIHTYNNVCCDSIAILYNLTAGPMAIRYSNYNTTLYYWSDYTPLM